MVVTNPMKEAPLPEKSSSFRHLIVGLKVGYLGGVTPYKIVPGPQFRLNFDLGITRTCICYSEFVLCNVYMLHLLTGWLQSLMVDQQSSPRRIGLQYMFFCSCLPWSMQLNNFLHFGQLHFIINSFMNILLEQRREIKTPASTHKSVDEGFATFLTTLKRIGTCVTILNFIAISRRPFLPYLLTSRIPNIASLSFILRVPLQTLQFYVFVTQWISVYGKMGQISAYLQVALSSLDQLIQGRSNTFWHHDTRRREEFYGQYRKLQVLQKNFDWRYSQFLILFEVMGIITIVLGILAGFRVTGTQGLRPLLAGGACLLILLFVWIKMAEVNETSELVLHSWKCEVRHARKDPLAKFLTSCVPVRIGLGSFLFADRSLVLTIISIIINYTVTLLVAH